MSTPRTDAYIRELGHYPNLVNPDRQRYDAVKRFARTLETELAEANKERDERTAGFAGQNAQVGTLAHEVTQLRSSLAASQERVKELERGLESTCATIENLRHDLKTGHQIHVESVIDNLTLAAESARALLASTPANP